MEVSIITVLYFSRAAQLAQCREERIPLDGLTTVADLKRFVLDRHPELLPLRDQMLVAVHEELVSDDRALEAGQVVALMPPFSGG